MGKEFIEYDNGTNKVPYRASTICFCLTDYARRYIKENRVVTKSIDKDVKDAVIVDAINYIGMKGYIDFALYTSDLQKECSNNEENYVETQCLITAIIRHLAYYLFYANPVNSIKLNSHMNSCKEEIDIEDAMYVVSDFINYILEVNGYDRVFTLRELQTIGESAVHDMEMRKLKDFLVSTEQYSEILSSGGNIDKLYRKVSSENRLNFIDKNGVYYYTPSVAKRVGSSRMYSWDVATVKEKLYAMMYAYGKLEPKDMPKNQSLQRILREMRTR